MSESSFSAAKVSSDLYVCRSLVQRYGPRYPILLNNATGFYPAGLSVICAQAGAGRTARIRNSEPQSLGSAA